MNAINELQCVIGTAEAERPRSTPLFPPSSESPNAAPPSIASIGTQLSDQLTILGNKILGAEEAIRRLNTACNADGSLRDNRMVLAQAIATYDRGNAIAQALADAISTASSNCGCYRRSGLHTGAGQRAGFKCASKITPLPTAPKAQAAHPTKTAPQSPLSEFVVVPGIKAPCTVDLTTLKAASDTVERMITGVAPAPNGFSTCIKAPPAPGSAKADSGTGTSAKAASQPLTVLPGLGRLGRTSNRCKSPSAEVSRHSIPSLLTLDWTFRRSHRADPR